MVTAAEPCSDRLMDEPTIDCTICTKPATLEVRLDILDGQAEWRTVHRYLTCDRHRERLTFSLDRLGSAERLVIQPCG